MKAEFTPREIRIWAIVMTTVLTVVGGVQYLIWGHERAALIFWILATAFLLPGLLFPAALKPVYRLWLKFAAALAWFNTRLILTLAFSLVFAPIGLILRLLRADLIKERWDPDASSYWVDRPDKPFDRSNYEKQY